LGYFQLIAAVDRFIAWDDVQYIQRGWVNRNRILLNGEPSYITLAIEKAAQTAHINERYIADGAATAKKILGQLHSAYRKAPFYEETRALVVDILGRQENNLGHFLFDSLQVVCKHLAINTELLLSSSLQKNDAGFAGSDRIIAICESQGASTYINAIGGRALYHAEDFAAKNIDLRFIEMHPITYAQGGAEFVPYLSIIDVLMFNERSVVQQMLQQYSLQS
jgi:hypothetical protein